MGTGINLKRYAIVVVVGMHKKGPAAVPRAGFGCKQEECAVIHTSVVPDNISSFNCNYVAKWPTWGQ